ncbi:MAG: GTP-binding protein, partial [Acidimicrobiaceae bacterium]
MSNIRNIALVAHVDHGKTTLLDALLKSGGTFAAHQVVVDRVMDSNDQERERGITILAKAAEIEWRGTKINLVDTPGHADFGGEVERALALVDGILLLVDAAEGPLPQTRYVLSKALAKDLPVVVVLNKVDRADARPEEVLHEVEQLFLDLAHHDHHLSFPVISAVARDGRSMKGIGMPAENADMVPLLDAVLDTIPAPTADSSKPLQALVANLDASDYLGRLAIGRVEAGVMKKGDTVCVWQHPTPENPAPFIKRKISTLFAFRGIGREEVAQVAAGDLFILAG